MIVLGIESTCDETGCALVVDGKTILSNVTVSQEDIHQAFGGVVPELACRRHLEVCQRTFERALTEGGCDAREIDLIAVANGPGLIGALLIGLNFAKGLSWGLNKPLVGVNHVEAHLYATLMHAEPKLPALGVVISGGHTALLVLERVGLYRLIGQTQDDAIGEAFDKAAKLLGLPYPGGPEIEKLAFGGRADRFSLNAGQIKERPFDFSFSGLKTALFYLLKGQNGLKESTFNESDKKDIAASFQHAAFNDLVEKGLKAASTFQCKSIVIGGGVSQNHYLRTLFEMRSSLPLFWPPKGLSLDNAAMIAGLGYHIYHTQGEADLNLKAFPRIHTFIVDSSSKCFF